MDNYLMWISSSYGHLYNRALLPQYKFPEWMNNANYNLHQYNNQYPVRYNMPPQHNQDDRQRTAHVNQGVKRHSSIQAETARESVGTSNSSRNYPEKRKFDEDQSSKISTIKKTKLNQDVSSLPQSKSKHHPPSSSSHPEVVDSSDDELDDLERVLEQQKRLSGEVWEYYELNAQKEPDYRVKEDLRRRLEQDIREVYRRSDLVLVGSSLNGFGCRGSDADFCLLVTLHEVDQRRDARYMLDQIHRYMRGNFSYMWKSCVIYAKVPIMRFTDRITGIDCDININNIVGIRNTHLLQSYSKVDRRVAPLVLWIKHWAKSNQINDASQGTLSSYTLALLVLHYLQEICIPAVLPSLQESHPYVFGSTTDILGIHASLNGRTLAPAIQFKSKNTESLGELLMGFFKHVAFFNFKKNIISVRLGSHFCLTNSWRQQWIHIEEPYEKQNVARAVHKEFRFQEILRKFKAAHTTLTDDPRCYLEDLLFLCQNKEKKTKRQRIKEALNFIKKKEQAVKKFKSFRSSQNKKDDGNGSGPKAKWAK